MKIYNGFKLNIKLTEFDKIRDIIDEIVYRSLKQIINQKFNSKIDFDGLMSESYKSILDDGKVRDVIINISGKPSCVVYIHEKGNYIQFFNVNNEYYDIILGCLSENYIEDISDEEKDIVWRELLHDYQYVPIDGGFMVCVISEHILSKVVEYFFRRYYEIINKEENPES